MKDDTNTLPALELNERQRQLLAGLDVPLWHRRKAPSETNSLYYVVGEWLLELNQPWPVQPALWLNDLAIALCAEQASNKAQVKQSTANSWSEQRRLNLVDYDVQQPLSVAIKQKLWAQLWQN